LAGTSKIKDGHWMPAVIRPSTSNVSTQQIMKCVVDKYNWRYTSSGHTKLISTC